MSREAEGSPHDSSPRGRNGGYGQSRLPRLVSSVAPLVATSRTPVTMLATGGVPDWSSADCSESSELWNASICGCRSLPAAERTAVRFVRILVIASRTPAVPLLTMLTPDRSVIDVRRSSRAAHSCELAEPTGPGLLAAVTVAALAAVLVVAVV